MVQQQTEWLLVVAVLFVILNTVERILILVAHGDDLNLFLNGGVLQAVLVIRLKEFVTLQYGYQIFLLIR